MRFERESELAAYLLLNEIKFLGQIHMNDEEYQELIEIARHRITHIYTQTMPRVDLYISLALVQIAIRCYQDGRYWPCLKEELDIPISTSKQSYLGRVFLKTLLKYKLFMLPSGRDDAEEYVENIKAHAFVTNHYMDGFFDFSYDYYETNLFRQIDEDNISDDIHSLSAFMKYSLKSDKNIITSDGGELNKASKSYRLLKATRRVFAESDIDSLVTMYLPVLKMIDNYCFRDIEPDPSVGRLEAGFADWCIKQRNEEIPGRKERLRRLHSNRPYIYVNENAESAYIVIPPQKFRYDDCNGRVKIEISYAGSTETYEIGAYKSFGVYLTEEERIPIDNIFGRYDITIKSLIKKEYSIKASNYRVFNKYWESREKFRKKTNILLVKHKVSVDWQNQSDVIDSYDGYKNWQYFLAEVNEKTVCTIGGNPVSLSGEFAIHPVYEGLLNKFRIIDSRENTITASKTHPSVSFTVDKFRVNGTVIVINGECISLKSIDEKTCFEWPNDNGKVAVTLILNEFLPYDDGRYTVYVDIPGVHTKMLCDYFLLHNFSCQFDKTKYIYDKTAIMTVESQKFKVVSRDGNCESCGISAEKERFRVNLSPQTKDVTLSLISDEDEYRLIVTIDIFKFGFDPDELCVRNKYIWYADVKNILYLYMPNSRSASVYMKDSDKELLSAIMIGSNHNSVEGELIEDSLFRIDISEMADYIRTDDSAEEHKLCISIERLDNSLLKIELPVIRRKLKIKPYFILRKIGETPALSVKIIGNADLFVDVYDSQTKEKVVVSRLIEKGDNYFPELQLDGRYDIHPYMEEADEFGFDVIRTDLHPVMKTGVVDFDNLEGCTIPITGIVHNESLLNIQRGYSYFVNCTKKISGNSYQGVLLLRKRYPEKKTIPFCYVRLFFTMYENTMNMYLSNYLPQEDTCADLYYNQSEKRLTKSEKRFDDNRNRLKNNLVLGTEKTTFRIDKDKIRRI